MGDVGLVGLIVDHGRPKNSSPLVSQSLVLGLKVYHLSLRWFNQAVNITTRVKFGCVLIHGIRIHTPKKKKKEKNYVHIVDVKGIIIYTALDILTI